MAATHHKENIILNRKAAIGISILILGAFVAVPFSGCGKTETETAPKNLVEVKKVLDQKWSAWCDCNKKTKTNNTKRTKQARESCRLQHVPHAYDFDTWSRQANLSDGEEEEMRLHHHKLTKQYVGNCDG